MKMSSQKVVNLIAAALIRVSSDEESEDIIGPLVAIFKLSPKTECLNFLKGIDFDNPENPILDLNQAIESVQVQIDHYQQFAISTIMESFKQELLRAKRHSACDFTTESNRCLKIEEVTDNCKTLGITLIDRVIHVRFKNDGDLINDDAIAFENGIKALERFSDHVDIRKSPELIQNDFYERVSIYFPGQLDFHKSINDYMNNFDRYFESSSVQMITPCIPGYKDLDDYRRIIEIRSGIGKSNATISQAM